MAKIDTYKGSIVMTAGLDRMSAEYYLVSADAVQANNEGESLTDVLERILVTIGQSDDSSEENTTLTDLSNKITNIEKSIRIIVNNDADGDGNNDTPDVINSLNQILNWLKNSEDGGNNALKLIQNLNALNEKVEEIANSENYTSAKVRALNNLIKALSVSGSDITDELDTLFASEGGSRVIDALDQEDKNNALSANQGYVLDNRIKTLEEQIDNLQYKAVVPTIAIKPTSIYKGDTQDIEVTWDYTAGTSKPKKAVVSCDKAKPSSVTVDNPLEVKTYSFKDISNAATFTVAMTDQKDKVVSKSVKLVINQRIFYGKATIQETYDSDFITSLQNSKGVAEGTSTVTIVDNTNWTTNPMKTTERYFCAIPDDIWKKTGKSFGFYIPSSNNLPETPQSDDTHTVSVETPEGYNTTYHLFNTSQPLGGGTTTVVGVKMIV